MRPAMLSGKSAVHQAGQATDECCRLSLAGGCADIRRLLVVDRRRVTGASGLPGSTQRVEIVIVPGALARVVVNEGSAPRVFRDVFSLEIGPVPAGDPGRTRDQGKQTLFRRRIDPDIELIDGEHAGDALDRLVG